MPAIRLVPPEHYPTLGWQVIDWIESYLCHGPGDVQGDKIVLDDEWCRFILDAYRVYPEGHERAGRRVVTYAEVSRPKGRAKSELAGMITCAEFLGPVRFDGWDAEGDPVGRPVQYPFIRCLATEEGQSGNTYDNVRVMLEHGLESHPDVFAGVDVGLTRTNLLTSSGGTILPSTASGAAKDGGKETFAVADETHLYVLPELRSMHRTVQRNLSKRKAAEPWMLATTTQFMPGQRSVAEDNRDAAEAQLSKSRKRRWSFMWDHREGHPVPEDKRDDEKVLAAALAEGYGDASAWMPLDRILEDEMSGVPWDEVERYWLNRRSEGTGRAVDPRRWDELARPGVVQPWDGAPVVLGFDGSKSRDATALVGFTVDDTPHAFVVGIWERPTDAPKNWQVPRDEVDGAVHRAFERWNVLSLVCDPPYWREYVDAWAAEFGEDRVLEFDTNQGQRMGPAVERFCDEAVPDGRFTHSGDAVLKRHVTNAVRTVTRGGKSAVAKENEGLKIDALVAAIIAYEALATLELPAGEHEPFVGWA